MARIVNITDGVGTIDLINDTYSVTAEVNGYDNATILPESITVASGTDTYDFTIAATGTLTLHVSEDGTAAGTPVVGATFIRTDSAGTEYGDAITTDASGNAVFNNVPFAETSAPLIYYKQLTSDGVHEFDNTVQSTSLSTDAETVEIENARGAVRTINLTDANYQGLPVETGTLTLTN